MKWKQVRPAENALRRQRVNQTEMRMPSILSVTGRNASDK